MIVFFTFNAEPNSEGLRAGFGVSILICLPFNSEKISESLRAAIFVRVIFYGNGIKLRRLSRPFPRTVPPEEGLRDKR